VVFQARLSFSVGAAPVFRRRGYGCENGSFAAQDGKTRVEGVVHTSIIRESMSCTL